MIIYEKIEAVIHIANLCLSPDLLTALFIVSVVYTSSKLTLIVNMNDRCMMHETISIVVYSFLHISIVHR